MDPAEGAHDAPPDLQTTYSAAEGIPLPLPLEAKKSLMLFSSQQFPFIDICHILGHPARSQTDKQTAAITEPRRQRYCRTLNFGCP